MTLPETTCLSGSVCSRRLVLDMVLCCSAVPLRAVVGNWPQFTAVAIHWGGNSAQISLSWRA